MSTVTRRAVLGGASAAALAASLPRRLHAQTSIKVGTAVLGDYALAGSMIVAQEKGFFREQGLNVEYLPFQGGPHLVKAVVAGDILLGATGATDVIVFREAGMPIKGVATHTEGNHFTLNVAPDVHKVGDLKGKSIGVTAVGATTWVFARVVAKQQGWDPDKDVTVVALGGQAAQLAALARKEIHAYVWGDGGAVTEIQGKSRVLMRLDAVTPKWLSQIQYVSEEGIKKHSEAIRKSMTAIFKAIRIMKHDPKSVAGLIGKKLGWSEEAVLGAHKISGPLLPEDGRMNLEALRVMQDTLLEHGVIKKRLPLEEHITTEFTPVRG